MANVRVEGDGPITPDAERGMTRREALRMGAGAAVGAGIVAGAGMGAQVMASTGAQTTVAQQLRAVARATSPKPGYGPLIASGPFQLPEGFRVIEFGKAGEPMSDGLKTPKNHDGSALANAGRNRLTLLRNQENAGVGSAIGKDNVYDPSAKGGVTSSLFDTRRGELVGSALVLNGTDNNCNGGPTPWGSWLSCEESTVGKHKGFEREHGYVFEVPFDATGPVEPIPIRAMGRFVHEACAIDPRTGIVYMTEDNGPDGFYRYLPDHGRQLHRGGRLEMLAVKGRSRYNTVQGQKVGRKLPCEWVPIEDPDPVEAERNADAVYQQGRDQGAARFMGLEGAAWANGAVHFTASEGGDRYRGQIWRYTPSFDLSRGTLELLYESADRAVLDQPDGIVVSPRGGVVVCEDGDGEEFNGGTNCLRVLTPDGRIETFAKNTTPLDLHVYEGTKKGEMGRSEWSGATYSPDGKWLFVHIQIPGVTYAITGPWEKGWL